MGVRLRGRRVVECDRSEKRNHTSPRGHPGRVMSPRQKEICMRSEQSRPQTFVEAVLALLEERFPWLGPGQDEPVGGADAVDKLADLYHSLIRERDKACHEEADPDA
jgi:hypothetical protein